MRFNTAIAGMMEFMNAVYKWPNRPRAALEPFVLLLAPYAPHIAEELWSRLGHGESLTYAQWPAYDEALLVQVRAPQRLCSLVFMRGCLGHGDSLTYAQWPAYDEALLVQVRAPQGLCCITREGLVQARVPPWRAFAGCCCLYGQRQGAHKCQLPPRTFYS